MASNSGPIIDNTDAAGCLLGLACGDALGRPLEFRTAEQITAEYGTVTNMLAHGTHNQPAGTITDDTELALCIARSLAENEDFDGADIARRFVEWFDSGPFDYGMMTADALRGLKAGDSWRDVGQQVWESRPEGQNAGNGSVMRCAPYAIRFANDPDRLIKVSKQSSAITHADPRCTYGCAILNLTLRNLITGREQPLDNALERLESEAPTELVDALDGLPEAVSPSSLSNSGYVVDTLQASLYYGLTADTAEDAIVMAVNQGNDADTVGAVTGAIAGAQFGADALPERWLNALDATADLRELATQLTTHASR